MIESKINPLRIWVPPIILVIVSGFAMAVLLDDPNPNDIVPVTVLWVILSLMLIPAILNIKLMTVDPVAQTITFTRYLTKLRRTYNFSDFDGYADMVIKAGRSGPYVALYLVKDERFVQLISGKTYLNLDEIEDGLSDMEYLGERKSSILLHLKILFGLKVL